MELGIRLSFVKTSEFRGEEEFEHPKPPSVRHWLGADNLSSDLRLLNSQEGLFTVECPAFLSRSIENHNEFQT
jgi:hypothetical protein